MNTFTSDSQKKWKGVLILLGGSLIHLVLGSFYLWGNINVYVTSYYRIHSDNSLTISLASALFCLMLLGISIGFFFGVPLAIKCGYRVVSLCETFLIAVCVFVSSFMDNFWLFVLFYGIFFGILSGLLYMIPIFLGCKYFPNSKGMVSGIITGAFGLATIFSSLIAQNIVNPHNVSASIKEGSDKYFPEEIADNLPKFMRYLSLYFLLLGLIGATLFFDPPLNNSIKTEDSEVVKVSESVNNEELLYNNGNNSSNLNGNWNQIKEILKTFKIYHIFLMNFFSSALGLLVASNFKNYGLNKINDDEFLTIVGSIGAVCNGCGRMVWGYFYDKLSFKKVYFILLCIQIIFIATYDTISGYKSAFFIWTCVILLCEGGHFALFPALCLKEYGVESGSKIYPVVYFAFCCSNFLQFGVVYFLKNRIGFHNIFWIFLGLTAVSIVLALLFREKTKEKENEFHKLK